MAVIDFEKKTGTAVTAEITETTDTAVTIQLKDAENNILDVYTLDKKTGIGTNQNNEEVSLPQTGNNSVNPFAVGAVALVTTGFVLMYQAGAFRRKEN